MNLRTTIVLSILLVLGLVGWFLFSLRQPHEATSETIAFLEKDLKADKLTRLEVRHQSRSVVLERASAKEEWSLPGKWPVRDREVEHLMNTITGLRSRFVPQSLDSDADLKKFGLDKDTLTLKVKVDGKEHTLLLGEEPGDVNRFSRATFLRLDDKKEAVRLAPGLITLLSPGQEFYQQRRLFPFERVAGAASGPEGEGGGKVEQLLAKEIAVKAPGESYQLSQITPGKEEGWELKEPVLDRVDPAKLKSLLTAFPDLWAERFIEKGEKKWEDFGLKDPEFVLNVTRPSGAAIQLLVGQTSRVEMRKIAKPPQPSQFGQPPMPPKEEIVKEEYRYAKLQNNDQVFEIKGDKLKDIAVSVSSLRDPQLARFKTDDARKLELEKDGQTIVLVKDKDKDRWRLEKPQAEDAETSQVTEVLNKLNSLEAKDKDIIDKADPKTYGLEKSLAVVKVAVEETKIKGEEKTTQQRNFTFRLGTSEKEKGKLFVQVEGWPRINALDDALLKLAERPALAYRSRRLLDVAAGDLSRLDIQRDKDAFSFEQTKGNWRLAAPVVADIESSKVSSLAGDLGRLEAVEWVTANPKEEELAKVYGLAGPALKIKIHFADAKKPAKELVVGNKRKDKDDKEKDEYFARLDNGPVFAVRKSLHDDLDKDSLAYRSDKLWDLQPNDIGEIAVHKEDPEYRLKREGKAWKITAPFEAPAVESQADNLAEEITRLKAEKFVAHVAKDLTPFGLEKPFLRVRILTTPPKDSKEPAKERTLLVGKETEVEKEKGKDKEKGRFARVDGMEGIFVLTEKALSPLEKPVYDLLDKALLTVDPKKIQAVASKGESTFKLENQKDKWQVVDSPAPAFVPEEDSVQDFLKSWAGLRAEKIVAYGPKVDWANFGLAPPQTTLTLVVKEGEKDGKTVEHTLALGKTTPDGMRYARLDQKPEVAVLGEAVVKDLGRSYLDFVNTRVLKFDLDTVVGLSRQMPGGDLEIVKKGDTWQITINGKSETADTATVENILEQTFRLKALRVAAYPAKDLVSFGLDNPAATITLKLAGGKTSQHVIKLGQPAKEPGSKEAAKDTSKEKGPKKEDAGRYAVIDQGEAVVVLTPELSRVLLARTLNFSDHNLANVSGADQAEMQRGPRKVLFSKAEGTWKMIEPLKADAEDAELDELIRGLTRLRADEIVADKTDLKQFGLDRPAVQWKLLAGGKEALQLLVGSAEPGADKEPRHYAMLQGKDLVFLLSSKLSAKLQDEYRSRKPWDTFDAAQAEKLTVEGQDRSFTLQKKDGNWSAAGKSDVKINAKAVTDTLDTLSRLKVLRFIVDQKADLQLFGLVPPMVKVEVELPSGKRTLHIGRTEGTTQRYYATVPGNDNVWVLSEADAQKILRNLAGYAEDSKEK